MAELSAYVPPLEGRRESTRLDFNENTNPETEKFKTINDPLKQELSIYPEYEEFLTQLAQTFDVPKESLMITNGSDEGLCVIAWTFIEPKTDKALTTAPTFALIPHSLKLSESRLVEIPYTPDWAYDTDAIEAVLKKGVKLAVFASPDNPTGALLSLSVLERWVKTYPETLFVMDEAYAEYAGQSALQLALSTHNLLVTRTFSKAWGLAGLRLGIIVGAPALISEIKKVRSPYSVNVAAMAAAQAILPDYPRVLLEAAATMARKEKVLQALSEKEYVIVPGAGNFFMMGLGLAATQFCDFMKSVGILVRDRSSMHPSLKGFVRVSIGTDDEMRRFLSAVDEFSKTTALLFDLDGTLVDTSKSFDTVVEKLVLQYSKQALQADELNNLRAEGGFNDDWEAAVELLKRRNVTVSFDEIAKKGQALYLDIAKETEAWLLNPEDLNALGKRFRLGIVTGRIFAEFDPVWAERMSPYFECVICQDITSTALKKPEPDLLLEAMQRLGISGGFYVGNSVDDMQAARAANLIPIGVSTTMSAECLYQAGAVEVLPGPDALANALQVGA